MLNVICSNAPIQHASLSESMKEVQILKAKVTYGYDHTIIKSYLWTNSKLRNYFKPLTTKIISVALPHQPTVIQVTRVPEQQLSRLPRVHSQIYRPRSESWHLRKDENKKKLARHSTQHLLQRSFEAMAMVMASRPSAVTNNLAQRAIQS